MTEDSASPFEEDVLGDPSEGWFKIVRAFFDHPLWVDCPTAWARVWLVILGHANWAARKRRFNTREIDLQAGELLCSLDWLSQKARVTVKQTRSALEYLERERSLTSEKTHKGTRLTVVNWWRYRQNGSSQGHAEGQTEWHTEGTLRAHRGHTEGNTRRSKDVEEGKKLQHQNPLPRIANSSDSVDGSDPVPLSEIPLLPADPSGFPLPPKMTSPWAPPEQRRALAQIGWSGVKSITQAQEDWIVSLNANAMTATPDDPKSLFSIHYRLVCFQSFWGLHPRPEDKRGTRCTFLKQCQTPDEAEEVVEYLATVGIDEIKAKASSPQYWKYSATWLNARPWDKKPKPPKETDEAPLFANEHNA